MRARGCSTLVTVQHVVTRRNETCLEALVDVLMSTRAEGLTFSFYVPSNNDKFDLTRSSPSRPFASKVQHTRNHQVQ